MSEKTRIYGWRYVISDAKQFKTRIDVAIWFYHRRNFTEESRLEQQRRWRVFVYND